MVHDPLIMTVVEIHCQHKLLNSQWCNQRRQTSNWESPKASCTPEGQGKHHSFSTELPNYEH